VEFYLILNRRNSLNIQYSIVNSGLSGLGKTAL
jgi:hypothetical protein